METRKFIHCTVCGNLFGTVHDAGVTPVCCGKPMEKLEPNTTDASNEKHVPVIKRNGKNVTVTVGSAAHPMQADHHIQWIALSQGEHMQRVTLTPTGTPEAAFVVAGENDSVAAYAYCNLHGLWVATA